MQRYYYSNFYHSNLVNGIQISRDNICNNLPEKELIQSQIYQKAKLEAVPELIKEGLSLEKIAKVLKLPLELVQQQIQKH